MESAELLSHLDMFSGSDAYHHWSILYPHFVLSDGAQYLADKAGAYWLMDIIGSYQRRLLKRGEFFQTWTIKRKAGTSAASVYCTDGNGNYLVRQKILFTDFPLEKYSVFAVWDGEMLAIRLKGEY